jgi:hypothetical protein
MKEDLTCQNISNSTKYQHYRGNEVSERISRPQGKMDKNTAHRWYGKSQPGDALCTQQNPADAARNTRQK